jgi:hypothetical protein
MDENTKVELTVNGKIIGLNPYVQSVFLEVIAGLVSTLKNTEQPDEIVVRVSGASRKTE